MQMQVLNVVLYVPLKYSSAAVGSVWSPVSTDRASQAASFIWRLFGPIGVNNRRQSVCHGGMALFLPRGIVPLWETIISVETEACAKTSPALYQKQHRGVKILKTP